MAFKVIAPVKRGFNRTIRGKSFRIAGRGLVTFSNELARDLCTDSRTHIAFFVNTDDNTLSFTATSDSNPMAKPFNPRTKHTAPNVFCAGVLRAGAQTGRWKVTGKQGDIYLTDCPVTPPAKASVEGAQDGKSKI